MKSVRSYVRLAEVPTKQRRGQAKVREDCSASPPMELSVNGKGGVMNEK